MTVEGCWLLTLLGSVKRALFWFGASWRRKTPAKAHLSTSASGGATLSQEPVVETFALANTPQCTRRNKLRSETLTKTPPFGRAAWITDISVLVVVALMVDVSHPVRPNPRLGVKRAERTPVWEATSCDFTVKIAVLLASVYRAVLAQTRLTFPGCVRRAEV